ncbi:two-component system response regulator [Pseudomonas azerbaijanoccidens]|jgi:putative two-component system response regulator|uniref:response regulator n=1 Tax=Pseudomonas azerbaijanoccidentalis TaxID=2842347 RepID=UPI00200B11F5|nr:two-component system response regulator [Pseudomonas azerbaijanoccidentalis]MCK8667364.1 two-component system response regulator [Pseudomonas azerbaijanoccidentalis]
MSAEQSQYSPPVILVVDDIPDNLMLMTDLLKDLYRVKAANSGEKALRVLQGDTLPDLILLDVMMPGLSGHEVAAQLKRDPRTRDIPIIFLTAMTATEDEILGLELGAVDYIAKPIRPPLLLARVSTQLKIKAAADFLRDQNEYLEQEVQRRTREVTAIQDVTIQAMASLAETRDNETGNHIRRTQHYIKVLAGLVQDHPRFSHFLSDEIIQVLFKSAPLHDIGKIGIPDHILLKPGRFTEEEFEIMKTHTTLGRDAIQQAEDRLGMRVDFLSLAKEIAYSHQEKWDGSGYPQGLAGDDIPISARLMAVADVYDALICRRVYKPGMPHAQAVEIIRQGRGTHFDPDICDAFLANNEQFHAIAERFVDSDQDLASKRVAQ